MGEQKPGKRMGRPPKRTEGYERTSIEFPVSVIEFLKTKSNRTEWILEAIQEKREREEQGNGSSSI